MNYELRKNKIEYPFVIPASDAVIPDLIRDPENRDKTLDSRFHGNDKADNNDTVPKSRGFTLIEMMVAISLFAVVMVIVIAALLGVNNANKRAQKIRAVVDNLSYSIEDMTRKIRTGSDYYCDVVNSTGGNKNPSIKECATGNSSIIIKAQKEGGGSQYCYIYYFVDTDKTIYRKTGTTDSGGNCAPFNQTYSSGVGWQDPVPTIADQVKIDSMKFHVIGDGSSGSLQQPIVIITISGRYVVEDGTIVAPFSLQTTVSQRSTTE